MFQMATAEKATNAEKIAKGDVVGLAFKGTTADGVVFEETAPGKAVLVVAGVGQVLPGLDDELLKTPVGEKRKVVVPKDKAFGDRDASKVVLVPLASFKAQGVTPQAGQVVELDGRRARVQSVAGGRVRVDFNHELAGQDLTYEYTIEKRYATPQAKLDAFAKEMLGLDSVAFKDGVATITVGADKAKDTNYMVAKLRFIDVAIRHCGATKVVVTEEYALPKQ